MGDKPKNKSLKEQEGIVRSFKASSQPYQDLVDRYKVNLAGDIRTLLGVAMEGFWQGEDLHSQFGECLMGLRKLNAEELPQTPLVDKQLHATLRCYRTVAPFYNEFEKIREAADDLRIDHNVMDGPDRVTRMILLDTGDHLAAVLEWLNKDNQWTKTLPYDDDKSALRDYLRLDDELLFKVLRKEGTAFPDWPSGIELHEKINDGLARVELARRDNTHHDTAERPSGPPKLQIV